MSNNTLGLDYESIKSRYPLSIDKIKDWFVKKESLMDNLQKWGVETSKDEVLDNFIGMMISYDMRKLYDPFDDFGIHIYMTEHPDANGVFLHFNSYIRHSKSSPSRVKAEENAFMDAFEVLENKLKANE